jgi:outer membrane protein
MKTTALQWLCASALLISAATPAAAQEFKMGYVNVERVLVDSGPAKAARAKLDTEFAKRKKDLEDSQTKFKVAVDGLNKDAPTLSETERKRRERDLGGQENDLRRRIEEFKEDSSRREKEEVSTILERTQRAIRQIAEAEKYDLVLQEVIFASARVDITEKVIKVLNAPAGPGK